MRFYFAQPGEPLDEGLDLPDAEVALREATDAALAMARERLPGAADSLSLNVISQEGHLATITVKVDVRRS
jgi:hypothetical protein